MPKVVVPDDHHNKPRLCGVDALMYVSMYHVVFIFPQNLTEPLSPPLLGVLDPVIASGLQTCLFPKT